MTRSNRSPKVRQWQQRMARFRSSRLSVVPFCQEEGVSVSSFYQWRKKLAQLPQPITEVDQPESSFTPVRLVASPSVSVRLPGGTQLDVPTADPQLFQLALQTLAQIDAQRIQG